MVLIAGLAVAVPAPAQAAEECQGRAVTLAATSISEKLQGTEGDDVISIVGFTSVEVDGRGGDDLICASVQTESVLRGGDGDDTLVEVDEGGAPHDYGGNKLIGGKGEDRYLVGNRSTVLSFEGHDNGVRIDLAAGTVVDGDETDTISGHPRVVGSAHADTFIGTAGVDHYESGRGREQEGDAIFAGAGSDWITAYGGTVHAGPGNDRVVGSGEVVVHGGTGNDWISLDGDGRANGGPGDDSLSFETDYDAMRAAVRAGRTFEPRVRLWGGPGNDFIWMPALTEGRRPQLRCPRVCVRADLRGGSGLDTLGLPLYERGRVDLAARRASVRTGRATVRSVERVLGSDGDDVLKGDGRRNRLVGRGGDDVLVGRGGPDLLRGGPGRDRAHGGPARDRCPGVEVRTSC